MSNTTQAVIKLFRSGMKQCDIVRQLGARQNYVSNILRDSDDRPDTKLRISNEMKNTIIEKYNQGLSRNDLLKELPVTEYDVRMVLRRLTRSQADSNHIKAMKRSPDLTKEQEEFLYGTLLGDGSISRGDNQSYRVQISHSGKHEDYIKYMSKLLNVKYIICKSSGYQKSAKIVYPMLKITYQNVRALDQIKNVVLINNKKTVNQNWLDKLTMRSVAYWFLDDGFSIKYKTHIEVKFCTQGFSFGENELLANWLTINGFLTKINKCSSGTEINLRMSSTCSKDFLQTIKPYVWPIECMRYKIKE